MIFSYGNGQFQTHDTKCDGEIILGEHKVYLRKNGEELSQSFVPLDKIGRVQRTGAILLFFVRLTVSIQYWVELKGEARHIRELCRDLVNRLGMHKKFLRNEWVGDNS